MTRKEKQQKVGSDLWSEPERRDRQNMGAVGLMRTGAEPPSNVRVTQKHGGADGICTRISRVSSECFTIKLRPHMVPPCQM
jgi:hypothetical protein